MDLQDATPDRKWRGRAAGSPDPGRHFRFHGREMHLRTRRRRVVGRARVPQAVPCRLRGPHRGASMPLSGELRGVSGSMSGNVNERPARNAIVAILGTPDRTEGSLDDPREREEDGVRFNEKWIYTHLHRDPAGAAMRTVYWMRYDFRGTAVRNSDTEAWR